MDKKWNCFGQFRLLVILARAEIRSGDSGSSTHKKGKKAKAISTALRVLASTGAHIPGVIQVFPSSKGMAQF